MTALFAERARGRGRFGRGAHAQQAGAARRLDRGRRLGGAQAGYGVERRPGAHRGSAAAWRRQTPAAVSPRALERGLEQLGTLGSGNHFLEVDEITEVYDAQAAEALGLRVGDAVRVDPLRLARAGPPGVHRFRARMQPAVAKYGIAIPTASWSARRSNRRRGSDYLAAMACAANYAWANRQVITHLVRRAFERVLAGKLGDHRTCAMVYDVCHNIAKVETHTVEGRATRAVRAPQRRHARLWPGTGRGARGLSRHRPAGADPRQHGHRLVCAGGHRAGHGARPLAPPATAPAARMSRHGAKQQRAAAANCAANWKARASPCARQLCRAWPKRPRRPTRMWMRSWTWCTSTGMARKVARTRPLGVMKG